MPQFQNSVFQSPQLLQKGVPAYLVGSFSQQVGNTRLAVTLDAIATNVGIVDGQLIEGPLPKVGDLLSVINSTNSAGAFNVNRAVITGVAYNATTNVMQIQFALTGTNQALTADTGTAVIEPGEVGETINGNYTSVACVVQAPEGDSQFSFTASALFKTLPTAATVSMQVAINANDSEWTALGTVAVVAGTAYTAGPVATFSLQRGSAYRFGVTGVTGTGVLVAKLFC